MFLREEREAARIGRYIRNLLKAPGWKALKDDLTDNEIYDWYDDNRRREIHENPFVGFRVEHEARLYMLVLLQKYVDASVYGLTFERAMHASAADELANLLHTPLPSPTLRPTQPPEGLVNPAAFGFKAEAPQWKPPPILDELRVRFGGTGQAGTGKAEQPKTAAPPPPSASKAEKLAKLLALISHPNTGEGERIAAMHAYQRITGEG
jgi:hypothetical protein